MDAPSLAKATDGPRQTVEALQRGQVRTLSLTDARDSNRRAYGGAESIHLALDPQDLTAMGLTTHFEAPLDELLLRATWGTGADVQFVTGGVEHSPDDGIGALLRYAD